MNIVIAGAGIMGKAIAGRLCRNGHDISIIEKDSGELNMALNAMDVTGICGNCVSPEILEDAGCAHAEVFIAATGSDETNLISCVLAKKTGAEHTIALLRDPDFRPGTNLWRDTLGISLVIQPDYVTAEEISRVLQFPAATRVEVFTEGEPELVTFRIPENSPICNIPLRDLRKNIRQDILICCIDRSGEYNIPDGNDIILPGDQVTVTGAPLTLRRFFISAGLYKKPVSNVILLGGSRISVYLQELLETTGTNVKIIERDSERAVYLSERLRKADIICADGANVSVLQENGLNNADAFVALTGSDENNIILGMYAQKSGVKKVITKVKNDRFAELLQDVFPDSSLSPLHLVTQRVEAYIQGLSYASDKSTIESMYYLGDGNTTATEYIAGTGSSILGKPLSELKFKEDVLLASVIRGGKSILPGGQTVLAPGDRAVVITRNAGIKDLDGLLEI